MTVYLIVVMPHAHPSAKLGCRVGAGPPPGLDSHSTGGRALRPSRPRRPAPVDGAV